MAMLDPGWALSLPMVVLPRKGSYTEGGHAVVEAEIGVLHLQAKEDQCLSATTGSCKKGMEWFLPKRVKGTSPAHTSISGFWLLELERIYFLFSLNHPLVIICYDNTRN